MSLRLARLLSVALLGACLATPLLAKTHAHARSGAVTRGPTLIWRGDVATAQGAVDGVAQAWERAGHGHIDLQPFNTASGIDALASGAADLAGSARGSDGSAEDANLTFTPVAWDALVIITNAANPVHNLSLKQVHDIYYGRITNWSQLGGRSAPIDVYAVASPADGVEYSLRQLLFGRGNQPVAAPRLYVNMRKLEEGIELNPNGLGAATLSDVRGNARLRAMAINGTAPTVANVADGSYPLYTPLYLVTNPRGAHADAARAFVDFMQDERARAALRQHAVLPYQDGLALASMDAARRSRILAEVGAHASRIVASDATPLSAPGATYAAGAAIAPTSPRTLAARMAMEHRNAGLAQAHRTDASDGTRYQVVKGDTLSSIASRHDIDVSRLRRWNHLKSDHVKPGQWLRLSDN